MVSVRAVQTPRQGTAFQADRSWSSARGWWIIDVAVGSFASVSPDHGDFRSTPVNGHSQDRRACLKGAKRRPFKTRSLLCQSGSVQEVQAKVPRIGGTTSSTSHLSPQPRQYSRNPSTSDKLQTKKMLREPRHSRHPNSSGADDAHSGGIRSPHLGRLAQDQKRYRRHVANLALQDMPRALLQVGLH